MISEKFKKTYEKLYIDDKRNKLSDELLVIEELLKTIQYKTDIVPDFKIKNYLSGSNMSEDDFLTFIYEDVFEIQKQLILITDKIIKNNK